LGKPKSRVRKTLFTEKGEKEKGISIDQKIKKRITGKKIQIADRVLRGAKLRGARNNNYRSNESLKQKQNEKNKRVLSGEERGGVNRGLGEGWNYL